MEEGRVGSKWWTGVVAFPRTVIGGAVTYLREVVGEMKRVRWPNRKELVGYTVSVVAVCVAVFILTYAFDLLVTEGFKLLGIGQ